MTFMVNPFALFPSGGIPQDYIAYYTMDNTSGTTLFDEAGNYDATAVTSLAIGAGYNGNSWIGDGTNYCTTTGFGITGSQTRTVAFKIKRGAGTAIKTVLSWGTNSNNRTNFFIHTGAVSAGDIYIGYGGRDFYSAGGTINTSGYKSIIITYSGGAVDTGTKLYVDGVDTSLTGTGAFAGTANTSDTNHRLFSDYLGPRATDCEIDDIYFYDYVLSSTERGFIDAA